MSSSYKYYEEFEKYKDVQLSLGRYVTKDSKNKKSPCYYQIVEITAECVTVESEKNKHRTQHTPHWARKNLEPV